MAPWVKFSVAAFGLATLGVGLAMGVHRAGWNRKSLQIIENLRDGEPSSESKTVSFDEFVGLPEPVAKYLRFALTEGQPIIRSVHIKQAGELRGFEKSQNKWMPFQATQFLSARRPGFLWDARIGASPWSQMQVRDAYVAGGAEATVSLLSLVTVADEYNNAELNAGALLRYLAESVWFPTALLPSKNLIWSTLNKNRALATLTDKGTTVSLEFTFNDAGQITHIYSPGRPRYVNGKYELTPWGGKHSAYQKKHGMWIPTKGEVSWGVSDGMFCVWRGSLVEVEYEFAF